MVDFRKIVVFAGQPENGRMGLAGCGGLTRARQRRGCLERRKQRSAEQPNLLPGHQGACALAESLERRSGSR